MALTLISQVRLKPPTIASTGDARPLRQLLRQSALQASMLGSATAYAVLIMVMTATPLAMQGCGLSGDSVATVIQWHVVGMFATSFFTAPLIKRFGALPIMQMGMLLLLGHVAVTLLGSAFLHFLSGRLVLGVGWNLSFIGDTALLTQTYRPAEQLKVQAVNEYAVFGLVALSTLSAGWLYERFGWVALNMAVVPLLVVALLSISIMGRRMHLLEKPG